MKVWRVEFCQATATTVVALETSYILLNFLNTTVQYLVSVKIFLSTSYCSRDGLDLISMIPIGKKCFWWIFKAKKDQKKPLWNCGIFHFIK